MTFFRKIIVAEKNNFSSNASHNSAKGKVIPKCKNDKNLKKLNRKSASPPPPPGRGNQNSPPPPSAILSGGGGGGGPNHAYETKILCL